MASRVRAVRDHVLVSPDPEAGVARADVVRRRLRAGSLRLARRADWTLRRRRYPRPMLWAGDQRFEHLLHAQDVPLRRSDADANELFERGKHVNVALAAPSIDGILLEPGRPFSFWRTVGRPSRPSGTGTAWSFGAAASYLRSAAGCAC